MSGEGVMSNRPAGIDARDIAIAVLDWSCASAMAEARARLAIPDDPDAARLDFEAEQAADYLKTVLIACGVNLPNLAEAIMESQPACATPRPGTISTWQR
jgi:hypothetical protein